MKNTLINLAEFHFAFGLIGIDEFRERIEVALRIDGERGSANDPRRIDGNDLSSEQDTDLGIDDVLSYPDDKQVGVVNSQASENKDWLEFLCLGTWVFTKSDPDPYPSVPHGHYKNKDRRWPKLNPYTGRVYSSKHSEDSSKRLTKNQMRIIWRDESFRSFCREIVIWYQEQFPYLNFPVRSPLRMPIW